MRIFFASTIGFQVPIKKFSDAGVIWKGFLFALSLLGKIMLVGFIVPNFSNHQKRYTGSHIHDCLIVGCSMAAEGEFAFVIATFGVNSGMVDEEIYASVVLAILISAVVSPFLLRFTIRYFDHPPKNDEFKEEDEMEENVKEKNEYGEVVKELPLHS
jgi:Kef-type K+ transport systems, membrane components